MAVLSLITLGIYILFWWYYVNKEMVEYGRAKGTDELGDSPGTSVVALFPGALVIVPAIMTLIYTSKRTQAAARLSGRPEGINGWIALVLYLVIAPAFFAYLQSDLNKTWEAQAGRTRARCLPTPARPVRSSRLRQRRRPGETPGQ